MTIRELFDQAASMGIEDTPLGIEVVCSDDWYNFSGDTASDKTEIEITPNGASVTIYT